LYGPGEFIAPGKVRIAMMWESAVVLVIVGVAAALLACRARKTLSGKGGCGCGKGPDCPVSSVDSLSADDSGVDDESESPGGTG